MPVTFGSVQLVPAASAAAPSAAASSGAGQSPPRSTASDARELAPALQHLHDRAARVRAH